MSDFAEFPKCLYKGNDIEQPYVVVFTPEEEALQNEEGFGVEVKKAAKKAEK